MPSAAITKTTAPIQSAIDLSNSKHLRRRGIRPRRTTCGIASPHLVRHRAVALVARANLRQRAAVDHCDAVLYQFIPGSSGHQRPPQRAIDPYRWLGRMDLGIQRNPRRRRRQGDHGRRIVGISTAACSITRDNTITVVRIQLSTRCEAEFGYRSPSTKALQTSKLERHV